LHQRRAGAYASLLKDPWLPLKASRPARLSICGVKKRIVIIQGHPDAQGTHFCNALAEAYASGARGEGHEVEMIEVARLDFALIRTVQQFRDGAPPLSICEAQDVIRRADHLVFFFPLWLGTVPALLKGFLEQTFRDGFAMQIATNGRGWRRLLKGKSARIVVTMGMPAFVYRWYFRGHGLKSLERSILSFAGVGPIRESLIGSVEDRSVTSRGRWLIRMQALGRVAR
jgi:putative NADPH-quinone reductase